MVCLGSWQVEVFTLPAPLLLMLYRWGRHAAAVLHQAARYQACAAAARELGSHAEHVWRCQQQQHDWPAAPGPGGPGCNAAP
jgi:hypothetical protein